MNIEGQGHCLTLVPGHFKSNFESFFLSYFKANWNQITYVALLGKKEVPLYVNDFGHLTKMAAMPIYGKNPSDFFFSRTVRLIATKFGM